MKILSGHSKKFTVMTNKSTFLIIFGVILFAVLLLSVILLTVLTGKNRGKADSLSSSSEATSKSEESNAATMNRDGLCMYNFCRKPNNDLLPSVTLPFEEDIINGNFSGAVPLHYFLSLRVHRDRKLLNGSLVVKMKFIKETNILLLHGNLKSLDFGSDTQHSKVYAYQTCNGKINCVKSAHVQMDFMILEFMDKFQTNKTYNIQFQQFRVIFEEDPFITQSKVSTAKWIQRTVSGREDKKDDGKLFLTKEEIGVFYADEMQSAWAFGSQFRFIRARTVFPSIDHPAFRAVFDLCLEHQKYLVPVAGTNQRSRKSVNDVFDRTCFHSTPPIPTNQLGFSLLENMEKKTIQILKANDSSEVVSLDFYYPFMYWRWLSWIPQRVSRMLSEIHRKLTGDIGYPFKTIKIIILMGVHTYEENSNFGLIFINLRSLEGQHVKEAAELVLRHRLLHSYLGGVVSAKRLQEICLEESFTTYLSWMLKNETNGTLQDRDSLFKSDLVLFEEFPSNIPLLGHQHDSPEFFNMFCYSGKSLYVFEMMRSAYGKEIFSQFLTKLLKEHTFGSVGLEEWAKVFNSTKKNSEVGEMLKTWFTEKGMPIIRMKFVPTATKNVNNLAVQQLRAYGKDTDNSGYLDTLDIKGPDDQRNIGLKPLIIPLKIRSLHDSGSFSLQLLDDYEKEIPLHFSINKFYADPDGSLYAHIIYDLMDYINIAECIEKSDCSMSFYSFSRIFGSFCYALQNNLLHVKVSQKDTWKELIDKMKVIAQKHKELDKFTCTCCLNNMNELLRPENDECVQNYVPWCSKIDLLDNIGRNFTTKIKQYLVT